MFGFLNTYLTDSENYFAYLQSSNKGFYIWSFSKVNIWLKRTVDVNSKFEKCLIQTKIIKTKKLKT